MKNIRRFLRRFLTGLLLCFLLFAAVNIGIWAVGACQSYQTSQSSRKAAYWVQRTAESLTGPDAGSYSLPPDIKAGLKKQKAWAMFLTAAARSSGRWICRKTCLFPTLPQILQNFPATI